MLGLKLNHVSKRGHIYVDTIVKGTVSAASMEWGNSKYVDLNAILAVKLVKTRRRRLIHEYIIYYIFWKCLDILSKIYSYIG